MKIQFRKISVVLLSILCLVVSPILPIQAETLDPGHVQPSVKECASVDSEKLQVAKELTDWLQRTLEEKGALVAVVARRGGEDVKKHDSTGMAHAGVAVYDPRAKTWIIYNLLNEMHNGQAESSLWRTAPLDFFYGQTGYVRDALILIPDEEVQHRMYEAVLNGNFKKLHFTKTYNLLSPYSSKTSLNCSKWVLMNVVAARLDNYVPIRVLGSIGVGFNPGLIRLNPIEKMVIKQKPNVQANEIANAGPVKTVTIESLYRSNLFTEKKFYSGRYIP